MHPHASPATQALFKDASKVAASVPAPNSKSSSKKSWDNFVTFAKNQGFDPMKASSDDIVPWLTKRSEETTSPAKVQSDLLAIKHWRFQAGKPLADIPLESAVSKGMLHIWDPLNSGKLGFKPSQLQAMLVPAVLENGPNNFAGLRQASLYVVQYWGKAGFSEIQNMQIGHVIPKGVLLS